MTSTNQRPPAWSLEATPDRSDPVLTWRHGATAWLVLNRPEKRNALDPALVDGLAAAFEAADTDDDVRAIVIAGTGKSFCAGADLGYLHDCARSGRDPLTFLSRVSDTFTDIERSRKPVIAAVHGHVVAGGLELALACDIIVGRFGTLIGDGHVSNGLMPAGGSSVRLPRRMPGPLARWLLLSGELVPVERLVASGLVHAVLSADTFVDAVDGLAQRLAAVPAPAQQRLKLLLHSTQDLDQDSALGAELKAFGTHWATTDLTPALRRFARHDDSTGGRS